MNSTATVPTISAEVWRQRALHRRGVACFTMFPVLGLTERCNLRCTYCYQESARPAELHPGDWIRILEQYEGFLTDMGIQGQITLTGGEPFVWKELPNLLDRITARRQQYGFAILTNGILVDAALAEQLRTWGARFVQVSIDGDRVTHDRIRGPGNFDRALAAFMWM